MTSQVTPRNKVGFYFDYTKNCSGSSFVKDSGQCRSPGDDWTAAGPGIGPGRGDDVTGVGHDLERAARGSCRARGRRRCRTACCSRAATRRSACSWGDVMPEGAIDRLDPGHRAVDQRRRADRQLHLPRVARAAVAEPVARHLAGVGLLRVGHAQPEGRLPGRLHGRRRPRRMVGAAAQLHVQQRRRRFSCSSASVRPRVSDRIRYERVLRPGCVDARAPDAAGRAALRARRRAGARTGENGVLEAHQFGKALNIFPAPTASRAIAISRRACGAVYDLFGNGKTAVKVNFGQYLQGVLLRARPTRSSNPATTLVSSINRTWTDGPNGGIATMRRSATS